MSEDLTPFGEVYSNLKAIHGELYASEVAHTVNVLMIAQHMFVVASMHSDPQLGKLATLLVDSIAIHNRVFCDENKHDLKAFLADKDGFQDIVQGRSDSCGPTG